MTFQTFTLELLKLCFIFLTGLLGKMAVTYLFPFLHDFLENRKLDWVYEQITDLVRSAEQQFKDGKGSEKRDYVLAKVASLLNEKGISLTQEQLRDLLESAVYSMKNE